jgi:LmbE family N-acetylglucosaminyl deacetylase
MDDRPNLILSPHFDDAVLSLGGLIAKAPDRATVVTIFAGTPAETIAARYDRWSGFATGADAMRARSRENDEALAVLGVPRSRIVNLGHLDNQYRIPQAAAATRADELRAAIAEDIRRLVNEYGGAATLFAPAMAGHPDHRIVTKAATDLHRSGACPNAEVLLYQDQPYAYLDLRRKTLVPLKFAKFDHLHDGVEKSLHHAVEKEFIELRNTEIEQKQTAIRRYKSQFRGIRPLLIKMLTDFSYYQARDAGLASRYAEAVYRLGAA